MKKKIFISHSQKDKPIVDSMIDKLLVGALSVKVGEIFCTTIDGTKIKSGEDWRDSIKSALQESLVTLLIVSPHYKESEVCICEMGAAWVSPGKVLPFIVPPIDYSTVGVIQEPKQIEKLLDGQSLDRLRDIVQEHLKIGTGEIKSDRWTIKKTEFIKAAEEHIASNPYPHPLSREEFDKVLKGNKELTDALQALIEEKEELESQIGDLKTAKDADEVKAIEDKYANTSELERFEMLCNEARSRLRKLGPAVIALAFASYSGKDLRIDHEVYREQIDEAVAKDYIDEDMEPDWETTKVMREIYSSLNDIEHFISEKSSEDFHAVYTTEYDVPLSLGNIEFWRTVIGADVHM